MLLGESNYKGTILQRNYRKMTMKSFFYNSFLKFHGQKLWETQHDHVILIILVSSCDIMRVQCNNMEIYSIFL